MCLSQVVCHSHGGTPMAGWFLLGKVPSINGWWLGVAIFQAPPILMFWMTWTLIKASFDFASLDMARDQHKSGVWRCPLEEMCIYIYAFVYIKMFKPINLYPYPIDPHVYTYIRIYIYTYIYKKYYSNIEINAIKSPRIQKITLLSSPIRRFRRGVPCDPLPQRHGNVGTTGDEALQNAPGAKIIVVRVRKCGGHTIISEYLMGNNILSLALKTTRWLAYNTTIVVGKNGL